MKMTWTLELDHDETIALARAIWGHIEHLTARPMSADDLTTIANLQHIIRVFPDEQEFAAITPQIVETKEP